MGNISSPKTDTTDLEMSKAALAVAVAEVPRKRIMGVMTPNTIPDHEVLEANLKKIQAQKQYEKAIYDLETVFPMERKVREQELEIAKRRLEELKRRVGDQKISG